jgi:hypothetical protein
LARAGDLGQAEVAADGHVPRHVDQAGDVAEVAARLRNAAGRQLAQCEGFERGDGHALPVDGVERADGVAGDQQLLREAAQPLVAAADAGREPDCDRVVQRLGALQRLGDVGEDQGGGEGLELGRVDRRVVPEDAGQGEDVPVALDGGQHAAARHTRGRSGDDAVVGSERSGAEPVGPAGVSQTDLEAVFVRGRVAELGEPARGA